MHAIVAALRAHDVQPALDWARDNREALSRAAEAGTGSSVEWQLHRLRFLTLLRQVRAGEACTCKRARLSPGASRAGEPHCSAAVCKGALRQILSGRTGALKLTPARRHALR